VEREREVYIREVGGLEWGRERENTRGGKERGRDKEGYIDREREVYIYIYIYIYI
jgi:hypothetical protein